MREDVKQEWVKRLRSGDYDQTRGQLKNSEGHCCMGVLCDVIDPEEWTEGKTQWLWRAFVGEIPRETLIEIDLSDQDQIDLIWKNDGNPAEGVRRHSFAEIANYIEKNL